MADQPEHSNNLFVVEVDEEQTFGGFGGHSYHCGVAGREGQFDDADRDKTGEGDLEKIGVS